MKADDTVVKKALVKRCMIVDDRQNYHHRVKLQLLVDDFFVAKEGGNLLRFLLPNRLLEELTESESRELWWRKQLSGKLSSTIMCVVKREKMSLTIMKNLNTLKVNDS